MTAPVVNPIKFTWVDATTNVDGSPITAGEVTGFQIGIRAVAAAGSIAGTYPILAPPAAASALNEALAAITPNLLPAGDGVNPGYMASIMSTGPKNSAWSPVEFAFSIVLPTPNPPSNFGGA